jgi:son of sevenless-like protein
MKDHSAFQSLLKPAQRKLTTTLSKLVISARAMQYESGSPSSSSPNRFEGDAEDLDRAIVAFVLAVERYRNQELMESERAGPKRLRGIFGTANVGLGLVGAGAAAGWKGLGWVALDDYEQSPQEILGAEVLGELASLLAQVDDQLGAMV